MIAILLPILFSLNFVFAQEQACPFAWKFDGKVCVDFTGLNTQCPNGQYFDYPHNMCVPEYFRDITAAEESETCTNKYVDEFSGEVICVQGNAGAARSEIKKQEKSQCERAITSTKQVCSGLGIASQVSSLLKAIETQKRAGNIKQACEKASEMAQVNVVGNAAYVASCSNSVNSCKKACEDDIEVSVCESYESKVKLVSAQSALGAVNFAQSKACADAASGKCVGEDAYFNSECTQFCVNSLNQNHFKCVAVKNNCENAQYASQNIQLCICAKNPMSSLCATQNTNVVEAKSPTPNLDFKSQDSDSDYNGNGQETTKNASVNRETNNLSSESLANRPSFVMNDKQSQSDKGIVNKDILQGYPNSNVSGGSFSRPSRSNDNAGYSGSEIHQVGYTLSGFNLKDYLPNGKKDPTRQPAHTNYHDSTITSANGLTNFQKVTRKMNEKRLELLP